MNLTPTTPPYVDGQPVEGWVYRGKDAGFQWFRGTYEVRVPAHMSCVACGIWVFGLEHIHPTLEACIEDTFRRLHADRDRCFDELALRLANEKAAWARREADVRAMADAALVDLNLSYREKT